jgi:hypothetical protein
MERLSVGNVLTDNLMPGMLLAADVHDRNGRLLLGAGTELTDKHIYVFRTWGVVEADIEGVDEDEAGQPFAGTVDPDQWAVAESEIQPLFRHVDPGHPAMVQLLRLSIMRRVRNGAR